MTSMTDRPSLEQVPQSDAAVSARMPRSVRVGLTLSLSALILGALYLVSVRGEALLIDLAALGSRIWCF